MIKQVWQQNINTFFPTVYDKKVPPGPLPAGVYRVGFNPRSGFFLNRIEESFPLPGKLYGLQGDFIRRVQGAFAAFDRNLGVLLNGVRGTGKTVTCKVLCNELKLPVILVESEMEGLPQFLSEINQTVVLFFDEFEKVFKENKGAELLSMMDGAASGAFKKLFLLTTNSTSVDPNLIDRPSRIRYRKEFANLDKTQVAEIVEDRLLDKNRTPSVVEYITSLNLITIDVVLALCDEVNLFGEDPKVFGKVFNASRVSTSWDLKVLQKDGTYKTMEYNVVPNHVKFLPGHERDYFHTSGGDFDGRIVRVIDSRTAEIRRDNGKPATIRVIPVRSFNMDFAYGNVGDDDDVRVEKAGDAPALLHQSKPTRRK